VSRLYWSTEIWNMPIMSDAKPVIEPRLLSMLCCPLTRSPLKQVGDELVAEKGGLRYPIREGIPVLLIDEAELPEGVGSIDELKKKLGM
jgi:uncharacterized protein